MEHFALTLTLFVLGIVLVVKGGDLFVDAASWIARAFGIPSFIIGATIVSMATTMPEMIVSVMAALEGKVDMAIGNAVGSVTANTAMIMALAMIFMTVAVKRKEYWLPCTLLTGAAAVLWIGTMGGSLRLPVSLLLLAIFLTFMVYNVRTAKAQSYAHEEKAPVSKRLLAKNIVLFLAGAAGIVAGSQLLVSSGSDIASALGVPERIIAVTLIAVGTSLPELVTTITAIVKKESSLSVGNIIGANIIDLTLILPVCGLVSGQSIPVVGAASTLDLPVCLGVILLAAVPMMIRQKASRLQGILLMAAYAAYLIVVI